MQKIKNLNVLLLLSLSSLRSSANGWISLGAGADGGDGRGVWAGVVSSSAAAGDGASAGGSSVIGSWAVEAPPPLEEEGWSPGQATCASKSSMLIMEGKPKP